jgi:hypothetical protein
MRQAFIFAILTVLLLPLISRATEGPAPLPQNGSIQSCSSQKGIAPLRIVTRPGSHYFVKLVDWSSNQVVMTLFIHSGETVDVDVPLGAYKLKYAAGKEWQGEKNLFGPETLYNQAEKRFVFESSGNQIRGYTVELILQPNGNLSARRIPAKDF